jgi:tetratricopeptide (TPR) repeat protein
MRNWTRCSGVYSNMLRAPLFLVCSLAALAQVSPQPRPRQDPMDAAIQAVWQTRNTGRFAEAATMREQARALLQRAPVDSPQFAGWVQQVAQLYQQLSLNGQTRAILQEALARTGPLPDSHPSHIAMLNAVGDSLRQDGNLLKAVGYLEQAAAAQAAAPPVAAGAQSAMGDFRAFGNRGSYFYSSGGYSGSAIQAYLRLAELYQQLGRPDAVAAIAVKIRTLGSNDESALAQFYEQRGQFEEAAAIYQKLAEQSVDPQAKVNAWQSLANLAARQEHYTDAIAAARQAIAAVQSSDQPGIRNQTIWTRQNLAGYLRQAGLLDEADQVYQQILQESRGGPQESQMLGMYAQYLAQSKRGAQGESLLKDYLEGSPNLDPQQKMNVLFNLANVSRSSGDSKRAEEYQQAGQAMQLPQPLPVPAGRTLLGLELQKAQFALNQHLWEDAYSLALHILDTAPQATDGPQVEWLVPQIAQALAANKEPARAEQLFQRLLAQGQRRAVEGMQPLIAATQNYARFLMNQPDRLGEVPAAIEQVRRVLTGANGPDSGSLAEPLRMGIEFERGHSQWEKADVSVRELLELQESLSGNTSDPYLGDLQNAARVYEAAGASIRALALFRKAVTIADLLDTPNNGWRRSQTRMEAAFALARQGQFDEAETLAEEAVALALPPRIPRAPLAQQLEQIRQMKQAAAARARLRSEPRP